MATMLAAAPVYTTSSLSKPSVILKPCQSQTARFSLRSVKRSLAVTARHETVDASSDKDYQHAAAKAVAASTFALLANTGSAAAAQEAISTLATAETDARPLLLLLVLGPAIGWVLFNILKPALNQFNKMKGAKSVVGAVGIGAAASALLAPDAEAAQEITQLAVDSRPLILLFVLVPAVGWVLFNILQPALRQFQNMSKKK